MLLSVGAPHNLVTQNTVRCENTHHCVLLRSDIPQLCILYNYAAFGYLSLTTIVFMWSNLGGGFNFQPYFGKIPILTNIFQMGWNHKLDTVRCEIHTFVFYWDQIFHNYWTNYAAVGDLILLSNYADPIFSHHKKSIFFPRNWLVHPSPPLDPRSCLSWLVFLELAWQSAASPGLGRANLSSTSLVD